MSNVHLERSSWSTFCKTSVSVQFSITVFPTWVYMPVSYAAMEKEWWNLVKVSRYSKGSLTHGIRDGRYCCNKLRLTEILHNDIITWSIKCLVPAAHKTTLFSLWVEQTTLLSVALPCDVKMISMTWWQWSQAVVSVTYWITAVTGTLSPITVHAVDNGTYITNRDVLASQVDVLSSFFDHNAPRFRVLTTT